VKESRHELDCGDQNAEYKPRGVLPDQRRPPWPQHDQHVSGQQGNADDGDLNVLHEHLNAQSRDGQSPEFVSSVVRKALPAIEDPRQPGGGLKKRQVSPVGHQVAAELKGDRAQQGSLPVPAEGPQEPVHARARQREMQDDRQRVRHQRWQDAEQPGGGVPQPALRVSRDGRAHARQRVPQRPLACGDALADVLPHRQVVDQVVFERRCSAQPPRAGQDHRRKQNDQGADQRPLHESRR